VSIWLLAHPSRAERPVLAVVAAAGLLVVMTANASAAGGAGVLRVSHREQLRACEYVASEDSGRQRARAVRACTRVARLRLVTRRALAGSATASSYQNPIYGSGADPMALQNGSSDYYAYHTGSNFPVLHSTDLVTWRAVGTALPVRPSWVVPSGDWHPWSPSVLRARRRCPGTNSIYCYYLFYTGLTTRYGPTTHCVGVATSPTPAGPFKDRGPLASPGGALDQSGRPAGCGDDAGYSNIDPAPFVDADGRAYLYLTTNRRCASPAPGLECPTDVTVSVIPLASNPTSASGPRKPLFAGAAGSWEQEPGQAPKVEGPWMVHKGDTYYLFYSGGDYRRAYGMGYATATSPLGANSTEPFAKAASNPVLKQTSAVLSPGGGSHIIGPQGGDWLLYHGRSESYSAPRTLRIDPVSWSSTGAVTVRGPSTDPQTPVP
jgi:beta-xylosidase